MEYDGIDALSIEIESGVATVTVPLLGTDEPTRARVHGEFGRIWPLLDDDDSVRSVLVTGTGPEFYLSGTPTSPIHKLLAEGDTDQIWPVVTRLEREVNQIVYGMVGFGKPVISAINGITSGAGLTVALLSDISIASTSATFRDPHAIMGLASGDGGTMMLPLTVGMAKAKLLMLTADVIDGTEAERIGLVSLVEGPETILGVADEYAQRLADGPPDVIRFTKRSLNQWWKMAGLVSYDQSFALQSLSMFGPDAKSPGWDQDEAGRRQRGENPE